MINTKLYRPPVTPDQVFRLHLIDQLKAKQYLPLTLVVAPAGYGKSVTISQWLDQTSNPNAWISLDDEHNSPRIFMDYLVAAIQQIFPGSLDNFKSILESNDSLTYNTLVPSLINGMLTRFPELEPFQRGNLERLFVSLQKRILNQLQLSAAERYDLFLEQYPDIEQDTRIITSHLIWVSRKKA